MSETEQAQTPQQTTDRDCLLRLLNGDGSQLPTQLKPPSVSVIVTVYNGAKYVCETLDSVRTQTLEFKECIIVEDGSTDDSLLVLQNYLSKIADRRFRLIQHEKNAGQLAAQSTGFGASQSDFIVFLDADDLLYRNALELLLVAHLNTVPIVPVISMDAAMIDANGVVLSWHHREMKPQIWKLFGHGVDTTVQLGSRTVPARLIPPAPANRVVTHDRYYWTTQSFMMFRADALRLIMPQSPTLFRICADYYLLFMLHAFHSTLTVQNTIGAYRLHPNNGYTNRLLISTEAESGGAATSLNQHSEMRELAGEILCERYADFARYTNTFKLTRALLGLARSKQVNIWRKLAQIEGWPQATFLLVIAWLSCSTLRVRRTFQTFSRLICNGR